MIFNKSTCYGPMIYPEQDLFVGRSLELHGEAQKCQVDLLTKLVDAGDVVIDVGANVGTITIPLANKVGPKGYVLALEAHVSFYHALCGNLALNKLKHVQAFHRAASSRSGGMFYFSHFDESQEEDFSGLMLAGLLNAKDDSGKVYDNPVASIAIDDLGISQPKLIKINVNRMEVPVLDGLEKTIRRAKPILYVNCDYDCNGILNFLEALDYKSVLHKTPSKVSDKKSENLICWHESKKPLLDDPYLVDIIHENEFKDEQDGDFRIDVNQPEFNDSI